MPKLDDMTPTEMPANIGDGDAMIIFKPEGVIVLLPNKYQDTPKGKLPKYMLMAMATAYALSDEMFHDYIMEHFQKMIKEESEDDTPDPAPKTQYH